MKLAGMPVTASVVRMSSAPAATTPSRYASSARLSRVAMKGVPA